MRSLALLSVVVLAGSTFVTSAYAQKSKREQAVATCIAQAQRQIPASGDPNDPGFNKRYNVYATCMRQHGQRP